MSLAPHGGKLTPRHVSGSKASELAKTYATAPAVTASETILADLECFSVGALAPLEGFLNQADYQSVVHEMRLSSGLIWSIPVSLAIDPKDARDAEKAGAVRVVANGDTIAIVEVEDVFEVDPRVEAKEVYRTTDEAHPGVAIVFAQSRLRVGGKVHVFDLPKQPFGAYRLGPAQTRAEFEKRGWHTVVAFQTRNPIHRAHEYLTKVALEIVDGLLLHPLVGYTKGDDVPADLRMQAYEIMMEKYYNRERVMLSVFPAAMRYAGPREAIFHALVRKNYGCTHFIVGRDHAGVGNYYGTYDAQKLFDEFRPEEIGITPLKFENAFYCTLTKQMATTKTSPSTTPDQRVFLSGTKVREMLRAGKLPPEEFTRPEVAAILAKAMKE